MRSLFQNVHKFCSKKTPLFDKHVELNGKLVDFAGYSLPIQYKDGIIKEHMQVREQCGIFDVSHMRQVFFKEKKEGALQKLAETLLVSPFKSKKSNQAYLSAILDENAKILDDVVATKFDGKLRVVLNAGNADNDVIHIKKILSDYELENQIEFIQLPNALLAVQGPKAVQIIKQQLNLDVSQMQFMTEQTLHCDKINQDISITRCGYTGEDGFEISVSEDSNKFLDLLLQHQNCHMAGLGARDSLRLEAGFCLHGHDINPKIDTPIESNMMWTVRKKDTKYKFIGQDALKQHKLSDPQVRLTGFILDGKRAPREGDKVFNEQDENIGTITSGSFSPVLQKGISIGRIDKSKLTDKTYVEIRNKKFEIQKNKLPFVTHNYFK